MSITAAQTETSVNHKFMAFALTDQNELHVWDINSAKARCLSRLKPSDLAAQAEVIDAETRFTSVKFSKTQVSQINIENEHTFLTIILAIGAHLGNWNVIWASGSL